MKKEPPYLVLSRIDTDPLRSILTPYPMTLITVLFKQHKGKLSAGQHGHQPHPSVTLVRHPGAVVESVRPKFEPTTGSAEPVSQTAP